MAADSPAGPAAHDHHVIVHAFAWGCGFRHGRSSSLWDSRLFLYLRDSAPAYNGTMQDKDALETLNWLVEAGADEAMGEVPVNRLAAAAPPQAAAPAKATTPMPMRRAR